MAIPSDRRHKTELEELGDPDLIPIMSIMCILIVLLVVMLVMYDVKLQEISLPKFSTGGGGAASKVLNLAVLVGKDQHVIKIQGGGTEGKEVIVKKKKVRLCAATAACEDCSGPEYEDYDYAGLYAELYKLKESKDFTEVDSINIGADDNVRWQVIARTIDAVRQKLDKPVFPDACTYDRAFPLKVKRVAEDGKESQVIADLFPKIVFVML